MIIPNHSIIYCDPPYKGTTNYGKNKFNHDYFWDWCIKKSKEGHKVFISEYNAPENFKCILEIEHKSILAKEKISKRLEKLFIVNDK